MLRMFLYLSLQLSRSLQSLKPQRTFDDPKVPSGGGSNSNTADCSRNGSFESNFAGPSLRSQLQQQLLQQQLERSPWRRLRKGNSCGSRGTASPARGVAASSAAAAAGSLNRGQSK